MTDARDTVTQVPSTSGTLAGGAMRGLVAGLVAGTVWWCVETAANWTLGGVIPAHVAMVMLGLDLAFAGVAGIVLGVALHVAAGGGSAASLALGLTAAYGLIRVYEPPGLRAEALFVVAATLATIAGVRLAGRERRSGLDFLHLLVLTTAATTLGKAGIGEAQSTYFGKSEPSGAMLPLLIAALPLAAVAADRLIGLLVKRRGLRFALELGAAGLAVALWARPLPIAPLDVAMRAAANAPAGAPDVILISLDTTRADHMSTYGYERVTSPNLTALANDALNFTQARSPAQWTVPGHASMFTGMYPTRHGAHYAGDWGSGPEIYGRRRVFPLADDRVTLAEMLRDRGYATAGFVANFANLYRGFGMAQGFARYEDHPGLLMRPVPHVVRFLQRFWPAYMKKPFRSADEINGAALAWMDALPKGQPAFVFLNYLEPHHYIAAPPYDLWARDLPRANELARKGLFTHAVPAGLSAEEKAFFTANYDGQILAMDAALGSLFQALKQRGRFENALVIVTADHGELLGEHDIIGHGGRMMYEGLLHIPMVLKLPGAQRPRGVIDAPVQLVDVVPTVAEAVGLSLPEGVQGEPLQRVSHVALAEEHINPEFVSHFGEVYNRALRVLYDGPYKLITTSRGEKLLFDLGRDPGEEDNLVSREAARVASMEERLGATMREMTKPSTKVAAAPRGTP